MSQHSFSKRLGLLQNSYHELITKPNETAVVGNGIFDRYVNPILTADHTPLFWRYDLNEKTNPYLMERYGINAVFNAGAIRWKDKYALVARVEGRDRKSFFAVAESPNGVDNFRFRDYPIRMPATPAALAGTEESGERSGMSVISGSGGQKAEQADTNIYDMRVVLHEDGWIYGIFCSERKDPSVPPGDQSSAIAQCGIARTKDLDNWERLADLQTPSPQQRNVVLHPEFVDGKYAFYTRPQDGFINTGSGGGIGFGLSPSITNAVITRETIIDPRSYHTINEAKNGLGPAPIRTPLGWLHLAHGVRNTAAGLRYTLYLFLTDLHDLTKVLYKPAGYFLAPEGEERTGDVSNVVFSNGWIADEDGTVYIYYASSDTRMHVATSSIDRLLDYVVNTPADGLHSAASVAALCQIIDRNKDYDRKGDLRKKEKMTY